jgi:Leucine-rich repeat (LRR) protein
VLIVANNQLRALPEEIGTLRCLRMLDAGHNLIADLPQSFARLHALTDYLYLHDNRLQVLSDSIFESFIHLRYLNLGDNPLHGLSASLGALAKLEELRLENIGLKILPSFLGNLRALDELALRNNRLASLPNSLEKLHKLRHLDLRGNRFTQIPEVLRALQKLHKLDLRWNDLRRIPTWLKELQARGCRVLL